MTNLFDISDKVIVITGGYGILGRAIARYLVGWNDGVSLFEANPTEA